LSHCTKVEGLRRRSRKSSFARISIRVAWSKAVACQHFSQILTRALRTKKSATRRPIAPYTETSRPSSSRLGSLRLEGGGRITSSGSAPVVPLWLVRTALVAYEVLPTPARVQTSSTVIRCAGLHKLRKGFADSWLAVRARDRVRLDRLHGSARPWRFQCHRCGSSSSGRAYAVVSLSKRAQNRGSKDSCSGSFFLPARTRRSPPHARGTSQPSGCARDRGSASRRRCRDLGLPTARRGRPQPSPGHTEPRGLVNRFARTSPYLATRPPLV
jgi:hypothetical protein